MDVNSILVLASAVVVTVVIWLFVGNRQLKFLRERVGRAWESVDEKYRKRQDVLPNLVETVRMYVSDQEGLISELIAARALAAREYVVGVAGVPGAKKLEYEKALAGVIERLLNVSGGGAAGVTSGVTSGGGELVKDTNFLQLRKEIGDLNLEIEKLLSEYWAATEKYNSLRGRFFMAPIAAIFRHSKLEATA